MTQDEQLDAKRLAVTWLRQARGFSDCPDQAVEALVAAGQMRKLSRGEVLVSRGQVFDRLGLVLHGVLEVSVSQLNGRRFLIAHMHEGDVVGVLSLFGQSPQASDLLAREAQTQMLLVPGSECRQLLALHPSLQHALILQMAHHAHLMHERLIINSSMSLPVRLARQLNVLSGLSGDPALAPARLQMRLSQTDMGDLLGVSRSRANAAAQQLRREGLIELHYASLTITDPVGLAKRAAL